MTLTPVPVQLVNKATTARSRVVTFGVRLAPGEITQRSTELTLTDGALRHRVQWEPYTETRHPDGSYMQIAGHVPAALNGSENRQCTITQAAVTSAPTFALAASVSAASGGTTFALTVEGETKTVTLATIISQALDVSALADGSIGSDARAHTRRHIWRQRWDAVTNQRLRGIWWEIAVETMSTLEVAKVTFTWGYSAAQSGIRLGNLWNDKVFVLTTPVTLTIAGCASFFQAENKVFNSVTRGSGTCTWVLRDPAAYTSDPPSNFDRRHRNLVQGASHCYEGELLFGALAATVPATNDDREGLVAMAMDFGTKGIPPFDIVPELPAYMPTREEAISRLREWELDLWGKGRDADPMSWSGTVGNANTGNTGNVGIAFGTMRLWIVLRSGWPAALGALMRDIRQEYIRPNNNRAFTATADLWRYDDFPTLQLYNGIPFYLSESTHSPDMLGVNGPIGNLGIYFDLDCPETVGNGPVGGWDRQHAMVMVQSTVAHITANYSVLRFLRQMEQIWLGNCDTSSSSVGVLENEAARAFGRGILAVGVDLWYLFGSQSVLDEIRERIEFAWRGNPLQGLSSSYQHSPARNGPQPPNTMGSFDAIEAPNPPQSGNLDTVPHGFPWQDGMATRGVDGAALLLAKRYPANDPVLGHAQVISADLAMQVTLYGWLDVRGLAPDRYRAVLIDRPYDDYRTPAGRAALVGRTATGAVSGSSGTIVGIVETDANVGGTICWALWLKDCTGPFATTGEEALLIAGSSFTCDAVSELGGWLGLKARENTVNYVPLSKARREDTVVYSALQPRPNGQIHAIVDCSKEAEAVITLAPLPNEHFLVTGDVLRIEDEPTWPVLNGDWSVTVTAINAVRLNGCNTTTQPGTYTPSTATKVSRRLWHNLSVKPYTGYSEWQRVAAAIALGWARLNVYGPRNAEVMARAQAILEWAGSGRQTGPAPGVIPRWDDVDEHCAARVNVFTATPTPPINLTANGASTTSIRLNWTNTWSGVFTDIQYRQVGTSIWSDAPSTALDASTSLVLGLAPRTSYEFQIRSRTATWTSDWVGPVTGTTQGDPPSPPNSLAASGTTSTAIGVSWVNTATNADAIEVEFRLVGAGSWTTTPVLAPTATSTTLTGLAPSSNYEIRVRATNASGASVWAGPVTASTLAGAPTAPTGLGVTPASSTSLDVAWTNTSVTQTAVEIQYQRTTETAWTNSPNAGGAATSSTITGLAVATAYRVRIRSSNASGPSDWVGPVTATTLDVVPTAPTGLSVVGDSSTTISASWTNTATNATSIETRVRVSPAGGWSNGAPLPPTQTSVLVPNLTPATSYDFEVRAVNGVGASAWVAGNASTLAGAPSVPTGLAASANGSTAINLTWSLGTGSPTSHEIEVRDAGSTTWNPAMTVSGVATSATVTNLRPSITVEARIRARNAAGPSAWSNTASATTNPDTPGKVAPEAPTGLTLIPQAPDGILVTWTIAASNHDGHEVQVRLYGQEAWTPAGVSLGTLASFEMEGLEVGTPYEVRIRAYHDQGTSAWVGPKTAVAGTPSLMSVRDWVGLLEDVIHARLTNQPIANYAVQGRSLSLLSIGSLQDMLEDALAREAELRSGVAQSKVRIRRLRG